MRGLPLLALVLIACASAEPQTDAEVARIASEVIPRVEQLVGLEFRVPPTMATRTSDQVRQYLIAKIDAELPPDTLARMALAYRQFGLLPDTLDLRRLLVDLLSEQVVGYYDPDSTTLFIVAGTDPVFIRTVLAHELVHALQGQYVPLDSVLQQQRQNDRRSAAQAVLEGEATIVSILAFITEEQMAQLGDFWGDVRRVLRQEQETRFPLFANAPYVIRQELLFPYLAGADFMRWYQQTYPGTSPYGSRFPASTEQILHPEKYRDADRPVTLEFVRAGAEPLYDDTWGEFGTRVVLAELTGSESTGNAGALGWDGDRFAIYAVEDDAALVWWTVWDSRQAAEKFARVLERAWPERAGRRGMVERTDLQGLPAVRLVDAPEGWSGWAAIPRAVVRE